MKKHGKKCRKLQAEKEARKEQIKVGEPYSKSRKKKRFCDHYYKLRPISDSEFICTQCHKIFSIDKLEQMKKLIDYRYRNRPKNPFRYLCDDCFDEEISELSRGLEPVYYRQLSENETEIIETIESKPIEIDMEADLPQFLSQFQTFSEEEIYHHLDTVMKISTFFSDDQLLFPLVTMVYIDDRVSEDAVRGYLAVLQDILDSDTTEYEMSPSGLEDFQKRHPEKFTEHLTLID